FRCRSRSRSIHSAWSNCHNRFTPRLTCKGTDMATGTTSPGGSGLKFKLCMMMFLQFLVWGAWYELGFDYIPKLGFNNDWQLPLIFGAFNIGALVALFFSTQFADRKFAAERYL